MFGLVGFLFSAAYLGARYISSETAQAAVKARDSRVHTDMNRQRELEHLSWGNTEYDRKRFAELLGRDDFAFENASLSEREYAVWKIAQKEGWVYSKKPGVGNHLPDNCYGYDPSKDESYNRLVRRI
jgi:hypothetical protein